MMSSECKEMTQKLDVLELFSKRKSVPTPYGDSYRLESGFCLHLTTQRRKEKICCPGEKQTVGWFSSVKINVKSYSQA